MDEAKLPSTLHRSELVIGDVKETPSPAHAVWPIGFISFDLDYYSSTRDAFRIFEGELSCCLPCRWPCESPHRWPRKVRSPARLIS